MDEILKIIGRTKPLFENDISKVEGELSDIISDSKFLVVGGAGTIGSSICRELFARDPRVLHVVDISENNMVELVRDLRSSIGYGKGEFATFAIDCLSDIFTSFIKDQERRIGGFDYVINTVALKHVRSEKDPYTLMRMIDTNIFGADKIMQMSQEMGARKYFCVSTDKAANPVNMMGASKQIMELLLNHRSENVDLSMARFANVAFSDGSLLFGFNKRIQKKQPISAPSDVRRYFLTEREAGQLCMLATLKGDNRDIFFPKLDLEEDAVTFSSIAERYLDSLGYSPVYCSSEQEARSRVKELVGEHKWPVYFFDSDTTGEKGIEEFYTDDEELDLDRYDSIGIIKNKYMADDSQIHMFTNEINRIRNKGTWGKEEIVTLFKDMLYNFEHKETGKYLDGRM